MPLWTPASGFVFRVHNLEADPNNTLGTAVTAGGSDSKGSWTQILAALSEEVHALYFLPHNVGDNAVADPTVVDIGWDPAGGSSYVAMISDMDIGQMARSDANGQPGWFFPIRIPAGATVACRAQATAATPDSFNVVMIAYGLPSAPWMFPSGQYAETIGSITGSGGVSFTPGEDTWGSWVSLGTTGKPLWWWQPFVGSNNAAAATNYTYVEYAFGDGSNKFVLWKHCVRTTGNEALETTFASHLLWAASYFPLPAGAELFVRGWCDRAPTSGYTANMVGIGG